MLLTTEYDDDHGVRLAEAAKSLAAARSVDEIVAVLCRTARDVVGSDGIAVVLREGDSAITPPRTPSSPCGAARGFP